MRSGITIGRRAAAKHAGEFLKRMDSFKRSRNLTAPDMLLVMAVGIASLPPQVRDAFLDVLMGVRAEIDEVKHKNAQRVAAEAEAPEQPQGDAT